MEQSILKTVKLANNVDLDNDAFDQVLLLHTNSVFSTLAQLGLGPTGGFRIEDDTTTWDAFIGDDDELNNVKTYVALKVQLLFDRPGTSFAIDAVKDIVQELEWRLSVKRESEAWTDPTTL